MKKYFIFVALIFIVIAPNLAQSQSAIVDKYKIRTMGNENANVVLYEYVSFTCPHCATFHKDYLPTIKEKFIDTGKVKLVFADFPLDGLAFAVSILSRCIENDTAYFNAIDDVFAQQKEWARSDDPKSDLLDMFALAGLSNEKAEICLEDKSLLKKINDERQEATKLGVKSTPTLMIDQRILKYGDLDDLVELIEEKIKEKQ